MKFIAKKQDILPALEKAAKVAKRSNMPILQNVLIKVNSDVEITASDLQISLSRSVSAEVTNTEETVVNAEKLYRIVKEMPEEVIFSTRENILEIFSDNVYGWRLSG